MRQAFGTAAFAFVLAVASPAVSQNITTGAPPSSASPGGIPPASGAAGDRTGSIAPSGQTKPPGDPVGEGLGTRPDLEQKSREIDSKIRTGICKGC